MEVKGVYKMIEKNKLSDPKARKNGSTSKKQKSFGILPKECSDSNNPMLCQNTTLDSPNLEKEGSSPYKSPTVLSFDAYGNLTSSDDPDAPYSHEVPSLAEFDYILGSFEGRFKKEVELEEEPIPSSNRNGGLKKSRHKKIKHDSGNSEAVSISDKDLKQVFKKDFDTTSVSATSRYGRTQKQKAQDGFLFGTINFNELRKITSSSPKKSRHSSSTEGKSDSDSNTNELEDLRSLSQNFDALSDKIAGYSSEEEFSIDTAKKSSKSKRRQTLPANIENEEEEEEKSLSLLKEPKHKSSKESGRNKKRKRDRSSLDEKRLTRSRLSPDEEKVDKISEIILPSGTSPKSENSESKVNETLSDSDDKDKKNIKMILSPELTAKKCEVQKLGSIQEDVNIIKSSLEESKPKKEIPEILIDDSNDLEIIEERNGGIKSEDKKIKPEISSTQLPAEVNPNIIEMETLYDEVKPEDALKTKYGRQVRKPILIDISLEEERRKEALLEKQKNTTVAVIEEVFLDHASDTDIIVEKENPCIYSIGDMVWVIMKSHPIWPGMITYPKKETIFTRINRSPTTLRLRGPRQYHVQFFFDNHQTQWVPAHYMFTYEGRPKMITFVNSTKEASKGKKIGVNDNPKRYILKCCIQTTSFLDKEHSGRTKTVRWHRAIEEADSAVSLERYERVQKFKPANQKSERSLSPNVIKKKKLSKSIGKAFARCETSSVKSKSSDDFSGFDEDSSAEKVKLRRMRLDERLKLKSKHGSFAIYLQKHLESTMENSNLRKVKAKQVLKKKWRKLTALQKSRYKSKLNYDETSSGDTDESSSDLSSVASVKSKKSSVHEDDAADAVRGTYRVPRVEKICVSCEGSTLKSNSDMIKCKGVCGSQFHLFCVGLDTPPATEFKCADCLSGIHKCFICKAEGDTIKCSVVSCGKFYHDHCVKAWPQVTKARQTEKFVCPRHVCHMCAANTDDMNDPAARTSPFTRCLRCPTTYHTGETCIAAGTEEISQNAHICTKHMKGSKNSSHHFNVNWCFCCSKGGSLLLCDQCPAAFHAECMNITAPEGSYICEDCENGKFPVYGDIVWVKLGAYRWWPGQVLHPRYIPDNIENLPHVQGMFCVHFFGSDDYYWLCRGRTFHYQEGDQGSKRTTNKFLELKFQKALDEAVVAYRKQKEKRDMQEQSRSLKGNLKPPPYVRIDTNRPVGNVRLGKLDSSTVTRCDCDPYSENPCGTDDKCINRMLMVECIREVCAGKDRCNNQRFQRREYPAVFSFKTTGRGWGLKTKEFIKKGQFVIEYVGELIDDAEFRRRIDEMHDYKEQNYYFLTVETDRLVDAGPKGNLARFMNHSCQPNCETQKWTVGADTRVGLFALEDIPEESELTFNYNLECVGTEKKKCNCGAPNCSGFIGVKVQKPDSSGMKKLKLENGVKKKKKKGKKKSEKDTENECFRCCQAGDLILCDMTMCPKGYHLECLGLTDLPKGKWLCPWHHCDECGCRASNRCIMCPNSYCRFHSAGNFHSTPGLGNVCMEHSTDDLEAGSEESGSEVHSSREHSPEVPT